jgi:type IV pilus assembly protein PilE
LIELMAVVVIVGVLTLVAYPAYQSYTIKSNRAEAKSYLMDLAQAQQLYFNDARTYADSVSTLHSTVPAHMANFYTVAVTPTTGPPPTFTITATPIAGSIQKNDGYLSIDNTGKKLHQISGGTEAW